MQLIDSEGNVVDEWTSDGTNHVVTELPVGKYVLKEIAAPDGYVIATDISFEVFEDQKQGHCNGYQLYGCCQHDGDDCIRRG